VLISLRGFQDNKADVIDKYMPDEVRALKTAGELPDSVSFSFLCVVGTTAALVLALREVDWTSLGTWFAVRMLNPSCENVSLGCRSQSEDSIPAISGGQCCKHILIEPCASQVKLNETEEGGEDNFEFGSGGEEEDSDRDVPASDDDDDDKDEDIDDI